MTEQNQVDNPLFKIEKLEDGKFKKDFVITIAGQKLSTRVDTEIAERAKSYKLAGFSKKGAPVSLVKRQIGQEVVAQEMDKIIQEVVMTIIKNESLNVGSMPQIEVKDFNLEGEIKISVSFMVMPSIAEIDLESDRFKLDTLELQVESSDLEEAKKALFKMVKSYKEAPEGHKACEGDAVIIDFHGNLNGEEFEGNKANQIRIELGEGQFIKDFENKLLGSSKGEEKTILVDFPSDYPEKILAGQKVHFDIKVHDLLVKDENKSEEEELKSRFNLSSISEIEQIIRDKLINDFNSIIRLRNKKLLFDKLDKEIELELPETMVEADFNNIWKETEAKIKSGELKKTEEEARSEMQNIARRRVKLGLVLADLSKKYSIAVTEADLNTAKESEKAKRPESSKMIEEFFAKKENKDLLQGAILEEKVVDFILNLVPKNIIQVTTKEFNEKYSQEIQELMQ
jgi:trigger factor